MSHPRSPLPALVRRAVREHAMWRQGETVVVGLSGGPDSTALVAALTDLPAALLPRVVAAHYHHGLRGADGDADADAAECLARALGVPFVVGRAGVPAGGGEAGARLARYRFLADTARGAGSRDVAVGHHRDDQVETVLLRLGRGTGLAGLGGIAPVRAMGSGGSPLWLVRPLCYACRRDILTYLAARGLPWRQDATNASLVYARNRIRHVALPALETACGGGFAAAVWRAAENLRDDAAALTALSVRAAQQRMLHSGDPTPAFDAAGGFDAEPLPVRVALLRAWWALAGAGPSPARTVWLRVARLDDGQTVHVAGRRTIRRVGDRLVIGDGSRAPAGAEWHFPGVASVPGVGRVSVSTSPWPAARWAACGPDGRICAAGDVAGIRWPLRLRPPNPGERIPVRGCSEPRRVRDLLAARGVPAADRALPWVLEDADGNALWIAGTRPSARFRPPVGEGLAVVVEWSATAAGWGAPGGPDGSPALRLRPPPAPGRTGSAGAGARSPAGP